jgi:hypothetical protein
MICSTCCNASVPDLYFGDQRLESPDVITEICLRWIQFFSGQFLSTGGSAIFSTKCICTHLHVIKTISVRSCSSTFCYLVISRCYFYAILFSLRCKENFISCLMKKGNAWAVIVCLHDLSASALHDVTLLL